MSDVLAYVRVSTDSQTTDSQRHSISNKYEIDEWFADERCSGSTMSSERAGFKALATYCRKGDTVVVAAIDRLGRDTRDVLETVEGFHNKGVSVVSIREGFDLSTPMGKAMLSMLAAMAELERSNIRARQSAGIARARALGRRIGAPKRVDDGAVSLWRRESRSSISETAKHFQISTATVKRACRVPNSAV